MQPVHPAIERRIGADFTELIEEVRLTGVRWGKAKADYEKLKHLRKIRLAELREAYRKGLEDRGEKVTEARLDDLARRSEDYKDIVLKIYKAAVEEAEASALHFARRNAMDAVIEQMRQERTEMKLTANS